MKKIGLVVLLVVAIMATVATAWGWERYPNGRRWDTSSKSYDEMYPNGTRWDAPNGYYPNGHYSPAVDLRDAHQAYWDEGLVDEVGKVITLPFTLPMRVKSEWERLNTKATHWKKVREAYEKGFPSQKEP